MHHVLRHDNYWKTQITLTADPSDSNRFTTSSIGALAISTSTKSVERSASPSTFYFDSSQRSCFLASPPLSPIRHCSHSQSSEAYLILSATKSAARRVDNPDIDRQMRRGATP
jgi:hypothetical protein